MEYSNLMLEKGGMIPSNCVGWQVGRGFPTHAILAKAMAEPLLSYVCGFVQATMTVQMGKPP
ncbi:hypothetical protein GCM10007160_10610 [Litchfieldella qijiaojingensis]|uniref:Uncharacterized protein n=1 Tax=Litchfieldella qijiaojingensis TaxID=980347 RepID=A0ABQ2YJK9_9GAMM|nr:hypothetical protein GCM10007160_10610 [Halomonas qijiaojingensis]